MDDIPSGDTLRLALEAGTARLRYSQRRQISPCPDWVKKLLGAQASVHVYAASLQWHDTSRHSHEAPVELAVNANSLRNLKAPLTMVLANAPDQVLLNNQRVEVCL